VVCGEVFCAGHARRARDERDEKGAECMLSAC
jgi:hypothetical protein